ncbi:DNA ligase 3 [Stomoxys calcitrans]|uniref:DNA ligase 3 n=1 Tax=Stomoxys calcitrans TaxID=35570 RepID=UPI0027E36BD1|nr:DNA ligase 3 [Stomoxys calcitrans]
MLIFSECKVICRIALSNLYIVNRKMSHCIEDNRLFTFTRVCDEIATERSYNNKAQILKDFLRKGTNNKEFKGDVLLWVRMLIPSDSQAVYNLQNKQMLKLFSRLFNSDVQEMHRDLEQEGDVSETLRKFFEASKKLKPQKDSSLYLQDVDEFLKKLEQRTKEDDQSELLQQLCKQTTANDLKTIIRIIKQDLRMNAKASHVLAAFGPMAYSSYQATRDLAAVVKQFAFKKGTAASTTAPTLPATAKGKGKKAAAVGNVQVMTPISPMLASPCNAVEDAFRKCPMGLFSEIKYDGERVQIHKQGNEFKFFSRNLKPVVEHKIRRFKEFIPKAFPGSGDMILDSEIIMVDTVTGELLPFGSLGAHKKKEFPNAEVCLFVFDCILYKGEDLTNIPCKQRREILEENITPIKNYVQLSESHFLKTKAELSLMTAKVLKAHLEGVVLKDPNGTYQPGKRGWLKVKKDYLFGGRMADTADLVVLGASYGSGKKGGVLSIFLMGCYDHRDHLWKTVTKVHTGLDDNTRLEMHDHLMKLMERSDARHLPSWFLCNKPLVPDFIAKDPKVMPVWEITGAEYTKSGEHTASGISIRFPRITRLREDKSAEQANDLEHLENMYEASKNNVNVDLLIKGCDDEDEDKLTISSKINLQGLGTPKKGIKKELDEDESPGTSIKKEKKVLTPTSSSKKRKSSEAAAEDDLDFVDIKKIKIEKVEKEEKPYSSNATKKRTLLDFAIKKEIKKEPEDEPMPSTSTNSKAALENARKKSELFKDLKVYFEKVSNFSELKNLMEANGGTLTTNTKSANLVVHETCDVDINLSDCRSKYRASCHHLSKQWILDCLKEKKLLDYGLHAVVLKAK